MRSVASGIYVRTKDIAHARLRASEKIVLRRKEAFSRFSLKTDDACDQRRWLDRRPAANSIRPLTRVRHFHEINARIQRLASNI